MRHIQLRTDTGNTERTCLEIIIPAGQFGTTSSDMKRLLSELARAADEGRDATLVIVGFVTEEYRAPPQTAKVV